LVTGSIWGKPTWGVWWDWDPRLTSSLVLFLMGCGYLLLRYFTPNLQARRKTSAIIAILGALNVPIVYYSVNLWRSLHQPQTFVEKSQNASADITFVLFFNFIVTFLFSIAIYKIRRQSISAVETLEEARGRYG
ncbi:MAG: cytochrome c biogenesis protein CcsA, partial [Bdellovibrionota bacterium]